MPRLFIAVWPPPEAVEALAALPRDDESDVRWTSPAQWHVTLRYLGDVEESVALDAMATVRAAPAVASVGPRVARLGESVLVAPVEGLDALAAAVRTATAGIGEPLDPRPFVGHITLGRRAAPGAGLEGHPVAVTFPVDQCSLVRSDRSADGSRYSTVTTLALTP